MCGPPGREVCSRAQSGTTTNTGALPHLWFCNLQIHQTVTAGGKVLVPVFAVGRAQELLMLLDEHWQRTELEVRLSRCALPGDWAVVH